MVGPTRLQLDKVIQASWSPGTEAFLESGKLHLGRLIFLMGVRFIPSAFGGTLLFAPTDATAPLHHANNLGIHPSLPQSAYGLSNQPMA